jgi:dTDP-4-dehydrorhamnose reductase
MKILLVSGSGLLGAKLADCFESESVAFEATTRAQLELARPVAPQLAPWLARGGFTHAVICAAMADVDACFRQPELSRRVNVLAVGELARILADAAIRVAFFSTDLVFDGKSDFCREEDPTGPTTLYGRQKLEAERLVLAASGANLVFRTSKLMALDAHPRNLLTPVLRAAASVAEYHAFRDQFVTPVFAEDVSRAVPLAFRHSLSGIYHVAGRERLSRAELARRACAAVGLDSSRITETSMCDAKLSECRGPRNTLAVEKLARDAGFEPTSLEKGLAILRENWGKVNA